MKTSLVWFKTDLRLFDNETLIKAIAQSKEVVCVYCFDEAHFETTEFGFKKIGNFRAQFLLESLKDLDANLRKLGSGLLILKGNQKLKFLLLLPNIKFKKYLLNAKLLMKKNKLNNVFKTNFLNCDANLNP